MAAFKRTLNGYNSLKPFSILAGNCVFAFRQEKEAMMSIWKAASEQFRQGRDFVLATILEVRGSSPRHVGTRFLIRHDRSIVGTIGGGLFEAEVRQFATAALESRTSHHALFSFTGKDHLSSQMICGGEAEVLVEFVDTKDVLKQQVFDHLVAMASQRIKGFHFTDVSIPLSGQASSSVNHLLIDDKGTRIGRFPNEDAVAKAMSETRLLKPAQLIAVPGIDRPVFLELLHPSGTVFIFGAGHVGTCVAHLAAYVNFRVVVVDDRAEFALPERLPDADQVQVLDSFQNLDSHLSLDEDSYVVIVTRGHAHDRTVLGQALKTKARYIGMIGSRRKISLTFQALLTEGFSREDIERVHAPIGLPIGGETPEEIAVSIVAEMIQVRNRKDMIQQLGGLS